MGFTVPELRPIAPTVSPDKLLWNWSGREDLNFRLEGDSHFDGGLAAGTTIVQLKPMPTAVVAMNDLTAIGIMKAVRTRGMDIPGDLSVTGYDFIQMAQYTSPSLTTVDLKRDLLGRIAADSLHDLFASATHMGQEYIVVPELRLGQSTGPPRPVPKA